MENNKNGSGIFYGVIGVATLLVTIIGATFAFFNASNQSANNAIQTGSNAVELLGITIGTGGKKTGLVPASYAAQNFGTLAGVAEGKCKDPAGNNYCSIYTITISNDNDTNQPIYVHFEPSDNGFGHLYYALFKGTPADGAYAVTGTVTSEGQDPTAVSTTTSGQLVQGPTPINGTTKTLLPITQRLDAHSSVTYTMIIWINEIGSDQTSDDANKTFAAGIRVATGANDNSGITAVLGTGSGTNSAA